MHRVSYDDVKKALRSLQNNIPLKYDTLPVKMLKLVANEIMDPISHIINKSNRNAFFRGKFNISKSANLSEQGH